MTTNEFIKMLKEAGSEGNVHIRMGGWNSSVRRA